MLSTEAIILQGIYIMDSPLVQMMSEIRDCASFHQFCSVGSLISVLLEVGGTVAGGPMEEYGGSARMLGGHSNVNVALQSGGKC